MEPNATEYASHNVSKGRLEMLFDGIFAIAMTILVLELKVPELADRHSVAELGQALAHHGATFVSYLLSFVVLGVLWYRHNTLYRHVSHVTAGLVALHLLQLAMAAFFPFCAALMGRYPTNDLTQIIYAGCVLVYAWAAVCAWLVAKRVGAISLQLGQEEYIRLRNRNLRGCLVITMLFALFVLKFVLARLD